VQCAYYNGVSTRYARRYYNVICPVGKTWNDTTKKCTTDCASVTEPLSGDKWMVDNGMQAMGACYDSCTYTKQSNAIDVLRTIDGVTYRSATGFASKAGAGWQDRGIPVKA